MAATVIFLAMSLGLVAASQTCQPDAVVGHCLGVGCFMFHGTATCHGTRCLCDPGKCSVDGKTCIPTPTPQPTPAPTEHFNVPTLVKIYNRVGCSDYRPYYSGHCNAELSWDGVSGTKARATAEFGDPALWKIVPVEGKEQIYKIYNRVGCPEYRPYYSGHCNAELSWDGVSSTKAMATVEFGDPAEWKIVPVEGKTDIYKIYNRVGCPDFRPYYSGHCNAELSWDGVSSTKAMATAEFGDPAEWKIVPFDPAEALAYDGDEQNYTLTTSFLCGITAAFVLAVVAASALVLSRRGNTAVESYQLLSA